MKLKYLTKSPAQTKKLGETLAAGLIKTRIGKKARVIGLMGDLGGGKTTFLQGFARGLGIKGRVLSPTFIIFKKFNIKKKSSTFKFLYHIDCYRLMGARDLAALGFRDITLDPKNIVVAEWADKIKGPLLKPSLFVSFTFINKKTREIRFSAP